MKTRKINPFLVGYIVGLGFLAFIGYGIGDFTANKISAKKVAVTNPNFSTDVSFVDLPRMNLSIPSSTGSATGRIRIDISLEVEKKNLARFEDYQPMITDRLLNYVRKLDAAEMHHPNAVPVLRQELLKEVNSFSYPVPVIDLVFRQFLVM